MNTLFGDLEDIKAENSLKITTKKQQPLSKNQQLFNKYTKRIENLEKEIISEEEKLTRLLNYHSQNLKPLVKSNAELKITLAMQIAKGTDNIKFSRKQKEDIKDVILALCNDAFMEIVPSEEQEKFYNRWTETSYKEELKMEEEAAKDILSEMMGNMFGMDIDMNEFDDTPEGYARMQAKMKEEFEKTQKKGKNTQGKKTKKQLEKEEKAKAEESVKNKSIRSIYIALAKILHPDTETDIKLKAEKEEIMKKVTSAYEQKDLTTLLKLEMEWVCKEKNHLKKLTEEKLNIYVSALKQQVQELEQEKFSLYVHPRYQSISDIARYSEKIAIKHIHLKMQEQIKTKKDFINIELKLKNLIHINKL